MALTQEESKRVHQLSAKHRKFIGDVTLCGCFYCGRIYPGREITEWIDRGTTALCPHCGIDSVLPEGCGYEITDEFLSEMNRHWFGKKYQWNTPSI
ncbi:MAG: cytoplasmic protein [Clostridia bacterium]|nr:cytoplasmic protein [Clostridia bacterium]